VEQSVWYEYVLSLEQLVDFEGESVVVTGSLRERDRERERERERGEGERERVMLYIVVLWFDMLH
jgi:hypothetical protein